MLPARVVFNTEGDEACGGGEDNEDGLGSNSVDSSVNSSRRAFGICVKGTYHQQSEAEAY